MEKSLLLILPVVAIVATLTELTSNTATASMSLPIMASLARAIEVHPLLLRPMDELMIRGSDPGNRLAGLEYVADGDMKRIDRARNSCAHDVLHLHRLEHAERLPSGNGASGLDADLEHRAD